MSDYLGGQRLLGYALGQRQRPVAANVAQPTQADLTAQADWDKIDLQVKSMISMRLSSNLRTLIGTMSVATWTNLEQHYGIPHFTGIYKDYELAHSIRLTILRSRSKRSGPSLSAFGQTDVFCLITYKVCSF
jgi:hypothetical protein